ncbi:hypothetical protein AWB83_04369 [Caballeronia ptereochthonis]|uniref:Uncharacterized protein n=1 Tax=Caballeronia ptereochthonis TaxID=1777144 RepID=A0A158CIF9_9BURK|nr:hypothetical protein AWB83_04369 [Caballeronia ptereochthonis]
MLNFVVGFFRDYWLVVLMCAVGHFSIPRLVDWLDRRDAAQVHRGGGEP